MKQFITLFLAGCMLVTMTTCKKKADTQEPEPLTIICEELAPFNYSENGQLKGITVEVVQAITGQLSPDNQKISITTNWDSALNLVMTTKNMALFTTSLTEGRKSKLQWVGPVTISLTEFVGLRSSQLQVSSIDDAKKLQSVGVITGYAPAEILVSAGFTNLVFYSTLGEAIAALYQGGVETVFEIAQPVRASAKAGGFDVSQLDDLFVHAIDQGYIAFSPSTSATIVAAWQDKLDAMKKGGLLQSIYEKYLPGEKAPGLVTIYTEENPPQNYLDDAGQLNGSAVEIIREVMRVMGREEPILLTSWNAAYGQALLAPNAMVFSTVRSEAREPLFQWVGPICKRSSCLFIRSDGTVTCSTIGEARQLASIAVPDGWSVHDELVALGFTNLVTCSTPQEALTRLMQKTADAAALNDLSINYLLAELGYLPGDVNKALTISSSQSYFAFSKDTRAAYLQEWTQAYQAIVDNGKFGEIWHKWYPNIDW